MVYFFLEFSGNRLFPKTMDKGTNHLQDAIAIIGEFQLK